MNLTPADLGFIIGYNAQRQKSQVNSLPEELTNVYISTYESKLITF